MEFPFLDAKLAESCMKIIWLVKLKYHVNSGKKRHNCNDSRSSKKRLR